MRRVEDMLDTAAEFKGYGQLDLYIEGACLALRHYTPRVGASDAERAGFSDQALLMSRYRWERGPGPYHGEDDLVRLLTDDAVLAASKRLCELGEVYLDEDGKAMSYSQRAAKPGGPPFHIGPPGHGAYCGEEDVVYYDLYSPNQKDTLNPKEWCPSCAAVLWYSEATASRVARYSDLSRLVQEFDAVVSSLGWDAIGGKEHNDLYTDFYQRLLRSRDEAHANLPRAGTPEGDGPQCYVTPPGVPAPGWDGPGDVEDDGYYCPSYCNKVHRLVDGVPIQHECVVLPPEALEAERRDDFETANEILGWTRLRRHVGSFE